MEAWEPAGFWGFAGPSDASMSAKLIKGLRSHPVVGPLLHRIPLRYRQAGFQLLLALRSPRASEPRGIFFLVCEPRTGSNLLMSYLNSHPSVGMVGEALSEWSHCGLRPAQRGHAEAALRHLHRVFLWGSEPVRGIKLFPYNLKSLGLTFGDLAATYPSARFLFLYRENLLEQLLSHREAMATGRYVSSQRERREAAPIHIGVEEFLAHREKMRERRRDIFLHQLPSDRRLAVSYEALTAGGAPWIAEHILPFLGCEPAPLRTHLRKLGDRPLGSRLANHGEFRELLERGLCRDQLEAGLSG